MLGDDRHDNAAAFDGFVPGANDINATRDGIGKEAEEILLPLADNGGDTATHALADDSPAFQSGDSSVCALFGGLDQRGIQRDAACNVGAFEFRSAIITINDPADTQEGSSCTLRNAIHASNSNNVYAGCEAGGDLENFSFDPTVFVPGAGHTLTLSQALPTFSSDVSLSG